MHIPTAKLTMPPARSTRPLKKLPTSSNISPTNLKAKWNVFCTRCSAVVKKDTISSTTELTRSEIAWTIEDIFVSGASVV